jgi:hypothetical protein
MMSPHESLSLNARRGLLAAVSGNPATAPGLVSIYDIGADCRHPVLDSSALLARFGHEGNFSPDGNTFWVPNPQVREISRLTWGPATIPQNAIPITIHGHPYVLEFDEHAFRFGSPAPPDTVGAARIIDIADEAHPRVVSNLRLEVNQPAGHHEAAGDPGASSPVQGYAAHYCNVPREVDPEIAACSFIASGLRVFDIRDPLHPREIAYSIAPPHRAPENLEAGSNFAMSKPAFAPERREIWYSDGSSGFYVLRLPAALWPDP